MLEGIDELGVDRWVRAAAVVISDQDFDVVAFRESTETGQEHCAADIVGFR